MNAAKRRILIVAALSLLVTAALLYGFLPRPVPAEVAQAKTGPFMVTLEEEGRTRLKERFVVSAPTAGYLRRIRLKAGDKVRKGQNLAILDPLPSAALDARSRAEAEAALEAAEAALKAARERLEAAAAEADYLEKRRRRFENLYSRGAVAKDQLEQAQTEAQTAGRAKEAAAALSAASQADVERITRTLQTVGRGKGQAVFVAAPVSGAVLRLYRESEGAVAAGEPLLEIGDAEALEVRVELLSVDAVKVSPGMRVLFGRWGGEGVLEGVVRVVEPSGFTKISSLGVEEQRVLVICDLVTPQEKRRSLGDGYRLEAQFILWEGREVLQIPAGALFQRGEKWCVFAVEGGRARLRAVEIGQRSGLSVQIVGGLAAGQQVIVHPDDTIRDGSPILPRK